MSDVKESVVQDWVKLQLTKKYGKDLYLFKVPQGPYASKRGVPDLVMSIKGLFVAIEVKTEHGKLTALQDHEIKKIREAGGLAFVIHGKSIPSIEGIFGEIERVLHHE